MMMHSVSHVKEKNLITVKCIKLAFYLRFFFKQEPEKPSQPGLKTEWLS